LIVALAAALLASTSAPASPATNSSPGTSIPTPAPTTTAPISKPSAVSNANVWQGITPGKPIARVRSVRGPSLLSRSLPEGSAIDWYPAPNDNAYVVVASRNDVVTYVRAFTVDPGGSLSGLTDPYGVTPGDTLEALRSRRGDPKETGKISDVAAVLVYPGVGALVWLYEFDNGVIHSITLYDPLAAKAPANSLATVADTHDGTSIGRAFMVHARNEETGVRFERYYATHRGGCSAWQITNQTLLTTGGRKIDQIDLECADNKGQTSLFFDVTSFFGTM